MFEDVHKPTKWEVSRVTWKDDHYRYDQDLYELGKDHPYSLVPNPEIEDDTLIHFAEEVEYTDKCIVFFYNGVWVAKLFPQGWKADWNAYQEIEIVKPSFVWSKNPDLDKLMTFQNDPFRSFEPDPWDSNYKLVWYMDPRVNPTGDKVWALSCNPIGREVLGVKDMGYVMPDIDIAYSEHLPDLGVDINQCYPAFWELDHELAWELDPIHREDEQMWVVKFSPNYRKPKGWKWYGTITPQLHIEYNPDLPNLEYDLDYVIPWHDLAYEHVWMLDNDHIKNGEEEIWAIKVSTAKDLIGTKFVDYLAPIPKFEINPILKDMNFHIDYTAPWHDLKYEMVWMLDPAYYVGHDPIWAVKQRYTEQHAGSTETGTVEPIQTIKFNKALKNLYIEIDYKIPLHDASYEHIWYTDVNGESIWAAKLTAVKRPRGIKEMGSVLPILPKQLDVIFVSYKEPNADDNWNRLLEFAPNAKRVQGVHGILNAHKAAANLATTDMFYVVDGDAWIADGWTFDFQPTLYDRDCVYVWNSQNPVNGLCYGYGGIKLFPTALLKRASQWGTDLTTSVGKKLKVINKVSNITKFNVSEFDTWRSAFRECVKLSSKIDKESIDRLNKWLSPIDEAEYAQWAKLGAEQGAAYAASRSPIENINDYNWLENTFKKLKNSL
jgi:hypothetical protein